MCSYPAKLEGVGRDIILSGTVGRVGGGACIFQHRDYEKHERMLVSLIFKPLSGNYPNTCYVWLQNTRFYAREASISLSFLTYWWNRSIRKSPWKRKRTRKLIIAQKIKIEVVPLRWLRGRRRSKITCAAAHGVCRLWFTADSDDPLLAHFTFTSVKFYSFCVRGRVRMRWI